MTEEESNRKVTRSCKKVTKQNTDNTHMKRQKAGGAAIAAAWPERGQLGPEFVRARFRGTTPYELGRDHGRQMQPYFGEVRRGLEAYVLLRIAKGFQTPSLQAYVDKCATLFLGAVQKHWPAIYDELRGIADGAHEDVAFLLAWNLLPGIESCLDTNSSSPPPPAPRCSAFIATGPSWVRGASAASASSSPPIMAHNTHVHVCIGYLFRFVFRLDLVGPHWDKLHHHHHRRRGQSAKAVQHIVMQAAPGLIISSTDWWVTSAGIFGCETTLSHTLYKASSWDDIAQRGPFFCHVREAMQYGHTLDDYVEIMSRQRGNGDYPSGWLLGDANTKEIMRLEIGQNCISVERTFDGYFYGCNVASSAVSLASGEYQHEVATTNRQRRFEALWATVDPHQDSTKLDLYKAQQWIGDHGVVQKTWHLSPRQTRRRWRRRHGSAGGGGKGTPHTICKHIASGWTGRSRKRRQGSAEEAAMSMAVDGKVIDGQLAKSLCFRGIVGPSCGQGFRMARYATSSSQDGSTIPWFSSVPDVAPYTNRSYRSSLWPVMSFHGQEKQD